VTASELESYIANLIEQVRERILTRFPAIEGLILIGSYGRGEGVVRAVGDSFEPANDLDFVLIFGGTVTPGIRAGARQLSAEIASETGVRHIDLVLMTESEFIASPPSMLRFDMRRGGKVLHGSDELLNRIPVISPDPFTREEIRNLLINRMVTLLEGYPAVSNSLAPEVKARQIAKAILAVTDAMLFQHRRYKTSYVKKLEALGKIAADHEDAEALLPFASWAFRAFMFELSETQISQTLDMWEECRPLLLRSIVKVAELCDERSYAGIGAAFPLWRGRRAFSELIPAIIATLKGREFRRAVEQQIARHLAEYQASEKWSEDARRLIQSWYNS